MLFRFAPLLLSATVPVLHACEGSPVTIMTQNRPLHRPVSSLLTPEARRELGKQIDVDALDELLASMEPGERRETLAGMGVIQTGEETRDVSIPMYSSDPERQKLIERVWAPYWDHLPPEWLDRTDLPFPGREIARARRAARAGGQQAKWSLGPERD